MATDIHQSSSETDTFAIAAKLIESIPSGVQYIALSGDLGAGKTHFVKGLATALQINTPVTSPTYTVYSIYQGTRPLIHIDAYRLQNTDQLDSILLDEFIKENAIIAVEWPSHVPDFFPDHYTKVNISSTSITEREISIESI